MSRLPAIVLLALACPAGALTVTHSGYLLDGDDAPVTSPGEAMTFRFWATDTGGATPLWEATCAVPVRSGYYSVVLGEGPCAGSPALDETVLAPGAPRWLELVVGSATLSPRVAFVPAGGGSSAWSSSGSDLTTQLAGNVGIGTATPVTKLDVNGGIRVGDVTAENFCAPETAGTIRWTGTTFQGCAGSGWADLSKPATPLTPASVSGLVAWFKADALSLTNGSAVASWSDASGNAHGLLQTNASQQPTFVASAINGVPAVRFDGVDDRMQGANLSALNGINGVSIFAVLRPVSLAGDHKGIFVSGPFGATNNVTFSFHSGGSLSLAIRNNCNCGGGTSAGLVTLSPQLFAGIYSGTAAGLDRARIYVNGTDVSLSQNVPNLTPTLTDPFHVGIGNEGGSDDYLHADLAELVVYSSTVSGADRQLLETYFDTKYALF